MYKQSISIFLSLFIISGVSRASVPFVVGILKYRIESSDGREQAVCCGFADNSHTLEPKPIVIPGTILHEGNVIPVVSIADSAFRSTSITGCTIPGSVESIATFLQHLLHNSRFPRTLRHGISPTAYSRIRSVRKNGPSASSSGHYDTKSALQHILASLLSGRLRTDFAGCCQNSPASSRMSRSVSGQPRHGSVMDLP